MNQYAKDLSEPKYEHLINNRKNAEIKHLNDSKAFIDCSNTVDDVFNNIDNYNPNRKRKIIIVFDNMIADIMTNKKFQSIIKELFIRCRKVNISLVFIIQFYFSVINHSADIDYKDFIKIYRECTKEPYNFLTIDTTLRSTNSLRFTKNLFDTL